MLYLLETDGVCLGLTVPPQVEVPVELLSQVAVAALPEQSDLGVQLHAPLKGVLGRGRLQLATRVVPMDNVIIHPS